MAIDGRVWTEQLKGAGECGKAESVARRDGGELDRVLMRPDRVFWDTKVSSTLGASHQAPSGKYCRRWDEAEKRRYR